MIVGSDAIELVSDDGPVTLLCTSCGNAIGEAILLSEAIGLWHAHHEERNVQ